VNLSIASWAIRGRRSTLKLHEAEGGATREGDAGAMQRLSPRCPGPPQATPASQLGKAEHQEQAATLYANGRMRVAPWPASGGSRPPHLPSLIGLKL
jgi:hypothetical protein